jgi:hypothetical protein
MLTCPFFRVITALAMQMLPDDCVGSVVYTHADWNPQMDLQAQARAHRLGQKRQARCCPCAARALESSTPSSKCPSEPVLLLGSNRCWCCA